MLSQQRNLKDMVNMGLSAKKEKDDRLQQMKKEVADLIRMQLSCIKSKVSFCTPAPVFPFNVRTKKVSY